MLGVHGVPEPRIFTAAASAETSATKARFALDHETVFLQVSPIGTARIRLYFDVDAFNADVNTPAITGAGNEKFIDLDGSANDFFQGPANVGGFWARAVAGGPGGKFSVCGYSKKA